MSGAAMNIAAVREKVREFDRVATALKIPRKERLAILNTTESVYAALQGSATTAGVIAPELERRLSYAMPLMRRLASNTIGLGATADIAEHQFVAA